MMEMVKYLDPSRFYLLFLFVFLLEPSIHAKGRKTPLLSELFPQENRMDAITAGPYDELSM